MNPTPKSVAKELGYSKEQRKVFRKARAEKRALRERDLYGFEKGRKGTAFKNHDLREEEDTV